MQKKIIWLIVSCLMVLSLVLASCGEAEEEEEEEVTPPGEEEEIITPPSEEEEVVTPGGGNWWDYLGEPEYGGILTFRTTWNSAWDPYYGVDMSWVRQFIYEFLCAHDWTLDRNIYSYKAFWSPLSRLSGWVAESWEYPDRNTMIFHIHPGIHWQDKEPANGREMTASDVAWAFNRMWGCGDGFTETTPYYGLALVWQQFDQIYATDKYTMVVTFEDPEVAPDQILGPHATQELICRDVVEKYGDLKDWRHALGTGPFMLDDYVDGASATLSRNPNYWGYDERHPENQLPYVDGVRVLNIPDVSTAYAALRTGKIDWMDRVPWEQAESLLNTNPELQSLKSLGGANGLLPRVDKEPFNDIRVRKAMDMAIDRDLIASTIRGGYIDGTPMPIFAPELKEYSIPFEEWPKELQEEYTYNPERARQLLAEAGYPDGFKTNILVSGEAPDELMAIQSMLKEIGIDMDISVMESTAFYSYVNVYKKYDQMYWGGAACWFLDPPKELSEETAAGSKQLINDPVYEEMYKYLNVDEQGNPRSQEEIISLTKEMGMYITAQHWKIQSVRSVDFYLWQPYLKGFTGESTASSKLRGFYVPRWWIVQDVKKAMGR
jgi:ABC-type transport system substrate-binding protein